MTLRLELARAALLLIDVQRDHLHPQGWCARHGQRELDDVDVARLLRNWQRLIDVLHDAHRPVVVVKTAFHPDYADWALTAQRRPPHFDSQESLLVQGSWGAEWIDGLTVEPGDYVVVKKTQGAFQHTHLDRLLSNLQVDHLVLAGGSVLDSLSDTARMGTALGYEPFLVSDAVYPPRAADLPLVKNRAELVTTDEVARVGREPSDLPEAPSNEALLIIDMQNDFLHPRGAMQRYGYTQLDATDRDHLVANVDRLARAMRARGCPVLFLKVVRRPDGYDSAQATAFRRLRPIPPEAHYLEYEAWGAELVEGLQPEPGDFVLEKKGHSAFGFTPVHRILRNLRVRRCLVTGGAISGCISDTVREGVGLGYEMVVVSDATYPPASPYLAVLSRRGQLRTTETILAERLTV
jgi:nicotinamidase-related amidase